MSTNPIVIIDGRPHWELAAQQMIFPLAVDQNGKQFELQVYLKQPYSSADLIEALNASRGAERREGGTITKLPGDDSKFSSFADKIFVRFGGGSSDDAGVQRSFLEKNPKLKIRLVRDCLGNVGIERNLPEDAIDEKIDFAGAVLDAAGNVIKTRQELFDAAGKKVLVVMAHNLRLETEKDLRTFERTSSESYIRSERKWVTNLVWDKRAALYDQMIESVDGMAFLGERCTLANRSLWLPAVPYWHKLFVVATAFDDARVKN